MAHIFVIAGHGAGDSGAVGNGYTEAERVRALAGRIAAYGGSNVTIGDTNRNYYADNGIISLDIPKNWQIIELHMDSGVASAKGGHVIVKAGIGTDAYDKALADFIGGMFPGRANTLVGRSDLANPNRAYRKGYGYRLIECGFISNTADVNIFNSRLDELANGIIKCFSVTPSTQPSIPAPSNPSGTALLEEDGSWGPATTRRTQQYLGTVVDGIVSNQPISNKQYLYSAHTSTWKFKTSGCSQGSDMVRTLQRKIGAAADGWFGRDSVLKLQAFLGVTQDASMGPDTVRAWQRYLNNH